MPIPRFWGGELSASDLAPSFALPSTALAQGQVTPNQLGVTVWNASGGTLTAGTLVYMSGWNAANSMPQVSKAVATSLVTRAQWVVLASIANGASGLVGQHFQLTAQNTNAATVGDPVFLDVNAGGYVLTAPASGTVSFQIVGRVTVKSATVGIVDFDLLSGGEPVQIQQIQVAFIPGTIPTTGSAEAIVNIPCPGNLLNLRVVGSAALATSDSNFIQFGVVNKGQAGAGSTQMLNQASGASSTKATGGGALVAYGYTAMVPSTTPANLVVARRDTLQITATVTGTLANTVPEAQAIISIQPT